MLPPKLNLLCCCHHKVLKAKILISVKREARKAHREHQRTKRASCELFRDVWSCKFYAYRNNSNHLIPCHFLFPSTVLMKPGNQTKEEHLAGNLWLPTHDSAKEIFNIISLDISSKIKSFSRLFAHGWAFVVKFVLLRNVLNLPLMDTRDVAFLADQLVHRDVSF